MSENVKYEIVPMGSGVVIFIVFPRPRVSDNRDCPFRHQLNAARAVPFAPICRSLLFHQMSAPRTAPDASDSRASPTRSPVTAGHRRSPCAATAPSNTAASPPHTCQRCRHVIRQRGCLHSRHCFRHRALHHTSIRHPSQTPITVTQQSPDNHPPQLLTTAIRHRFPSQLSVTAIHHSYPPTHPSQSPVNAPITPTRQRTRHRHPSTPPVNAPVIATRQRTRQRTYPSQSPVNAPVTATRQRTRHRQSAVTSGH